MIVLSQKEILLLVFSVSAAAALTPKADASVLYNSIDNSTFSIVDGQLQALASSVNSVGQRFSAVNIIGDGGKLSSIEWYAVADRPTDYEYLNRLAIAFYEGGTNQFMNSPDMTTASQLIQPLTASGNISGYTTPITEINGRFVFHIKATNLDSFNIQTITGAEHMIGFAVNGQFLSTPGGIALVDGAFGESRMYWNPGSGINPPKTFEQLNFNAPYDAVKVTTGAVPEPATMLGLGLGVLALIRRKSKRSDV